MMLKVLVYNDNMSLIVNSIIYNISQQATTRFFVDGRA